MPRLGLALSGGGFRATLYHLGVVRFLRDAGSLQHVSDIASVSGGSIFAAHLVLNWDRYNGTDEAFDAAASEIIRFVQFDVRNHIVRRLPLQYLLRPLVRLSFLDRRDLTPNAILERYYRDFLYGDTCLYELPEQPMLHLLTTNVSGGGLSVFNRQGLFIQRRDHDGSIRVTQVDGQMASIPRVVGASSAFPGFFPPVEITAADLGVREGQFPTEYFTDGGVYDNLGIRAFSWLQQQEGPYDQILVSDAGKPFQILSNVSLGVIGQAVRASDILMDRVWQLELENFSRRDGFVLFPITTSVALSEDPTALSPVIQSEVQSIRTDLDRFSALEINMLAQHGYEVARSVCRHLAAADDSTIPDAPPWTPIPQSEPNRSSRTSEQSGQPSNATRLARKLRQSSRRRVFSTLLDWRDWPSYVYGLLAVLLFFYMPLQVYQLYRTSQTQAAIIASITSGDPDIRQILELTTSDPLSDWVAEPIQEKAAASTPNYEGVEVLTHSRIYDLREWRPDEDSPERQGRVYVRDRITVQLLDSYRGDGHLVFVVPTKAREVDFRQPNPEMRASISRITEPVEQNRQQRWLFEFEYDLSQVPPGEPVTLEMESFASFPKTARAPFVTHTKTDLISVWILFPRDRPYRTYSLVSYPADHSTPAKLMSNRYAIDHPYGSLIGWSVVNPEESRIYECRWTLE